MEVHPALQIQGGKPNSGVWAKLRHVDACDITELVSFSDSSVEVWEIKNVLVYSCYLGGTGYMGTEIIVVSFHICRDTCVLVFYLMELSSSHFSFQVFPLSVLLRAVALGYLNALEQRTA